ncbi:MAG: ATP-binding cassette domain-containing protein, partial [Pyrinomonadaceae bacterium]
KRVALAHSLIEKPDLLILDEPTNHLDADTVNWLESYLARYSGTLLLVTHDRYFLDRVTNRILEIDRGAVQSFNGNYAYYLERKEEQDTLRAVEGQKRKMLIRHELAWLRRGAKARTRKSKSRIDAAEALMSAPVETAKAELDIAIGSRRLGTKVVEIHEVSKAYDGRKLIDKFTYLLKRNDRIGIIGPNGAGKTTLLEMITGRVPPDDGRIEIGQTVVIGYYNQESRALQRRSARDRLYSRSGRACANNRWLAHHCEPNARKISLSAFGAVRFDRQTLRWRAAQIVSAAHIDERPKRSTAR